MTRTSAQPVIRAYVVRGEDDDRLRRAVVTLAPPYSKRYRAEARWHVPVGDETPAVSVTVIELDHGWRIGMRGRRVWFMADPEATPAVAHGLWEDALVIFGIANQQFGRGPGAITHDDQIRAVIAKMRQNHLKISGPAIATYSGEFTVHNLRYYLRKRHQTLRRDYLK